MTKAIKTLVVVVLAGAALAVAAAPASAHGGGRHGLVSKHALIQAAADYLGVTATSLSTSLQSGQTLAQITAATQGRSVQGLTDALVAAGTAQINAAVAAGKMTAAKAAAKIAALPALVQALVNGTLQVGGCSHAGAGGSGFRHR